MIRRNIVAIVASCAALAAGIALGGGPLSDAVHADDGTTAAAAAGRAPAAGSAFGQKWAAQAAPLLYGGRLAGRSIAVVTMPGAPPQVVQQLDDGIAVAKGTVVTTMSLQPTLLDTTQRTLADTLGTKFAQQSRGAVDAGAPTYARLGQIIGVALAGAPSAQSQGMGQDAQKTLAAGKLASLKGGRSRASVVLLVLGSHADTGALGDLIDGIGARTGGVVVAGDTASGNGGDLKALRAAGHSDKVLTVDGDETAYGRASVILGLVRRIGGSGGDFGASGIDGLVPLG